MCSTELSHSSFLVVKLFNLWDKFVPLPVVMSCSFPSLQCWRINIPSVFLAACMNWENRGDWRQEKQKVAKGVVILNDFFLHFFQP